MAVADPPVSVPLNHSRREVIIKLLLFLGLISLAAVRKTKVVRETKVDCQDDYLTADDGVTPLTADDGVTLLTTGSQQCQLVEPDDLPGPLPSWLRTNLKRIFCSLDHRETERLMSVCTLSSRRLRY